MFALLIIASVIASTSPAQPAASPTTVPLREVVYKFHFGRTTEGTANNLFGTQPMSLDVKGGYNGRITVDVTQVDSAGLMLVTVTETVDTASFHLKTPI